MLFCNILRTWQWAINGVGAVCNGDVQNRVYLWIHLITPSQGNGILLEESHSKRPIAVASVCIHAVTFLGTCVLHEEPRPVLVWYRKQPPPAPSPKPPLTLLCLSFPVKTLACLCLTGELFSFSPYNNVLFLVLPPALWHKPVHESKSEVAQL